MARYVVRMHDGTNNLICSGSGADLAIVFITPRLVSALKRSYDTAGVDIRPLKVAEFRIYWQFLVYRDNGEAQMDGWDGKSAYKLPDDFRTTAQQGRVEDCSISIHGYVLQLHGSIKPENWSSAMPIYSDPIEISTLDI